MLQGPIMTCGVGPMVCLTRAQNGAIWPTDRGHRVHPMQWGIPHVGGFTPHVGGFGKLFTVHVHVHCLTAVHVHWVYTNSKVQHLVMHPFENSDTYTKTPISFEPEGVMRPEKAQIIPLRKLYATVYRDAIMHTLYESYGRFSIAAN